MGKEKKPQIKTSYNSISCNSLFSLHFYSIFFITTEAFYYITNRSSFWSASNLFFNELNFHQKEIFSSVLGKKNQLHYKEQEILHRIWCLLSQRWFNYLSSIKSKHRALSHSVQNQEKEVCLSRTTRGSLTVIQKCWIFTAWKMQFRVPLKKSLTASTQHFTIWALLL